MIYSYDLKYRMNYLMIYLYYLYSLFLCEALKIFYDNFVIVYKNGYMINFYSLEKFVNRNYESVLLYKENKYYYMNKSNLNTTLSNTKIFGIDIEVLNEIVHVKPKYNLFTLNNIILDDTFVKWYLKNHGYYFIPNYKIHILNEEFKIMIMNKNQYMCIEEDKYIINEKY